MNNEFAGFAIAARVVLRRNWLRMAIWTVVLAVLIVAVVNYQRDLFPDQAAREAYATTASTPGVAALTGLPYAAATECGILNIKLWMTGAITLALVCIFLVTRNGRAEEESGRLELLRAGMLGRHAFSLAGWLVTGTFAIIAGLVSATAAIAMGLPISGSLLMGLSWSALGIAFIGIAAVTGQLAATGRGANAWAAIVLALAYVIRAVADVNATAGTAAWYTWLSPIGWAQQTRSFGEDQWWALVPLLVLGLGGCSVAVMLEGSRDLGAGIIALRPGPVSASALTRTVVGLPLRLQRTSLISWSIGCAFAGIFFGGIATVMESLLADIGTSSLTAALTAGADTQLDGLLGFFLVFFAVFVAAFAVQSTLTLRGDEAAGYTGLEWTASVSRLAWGLARCLIPAVASLGMLVIGGGLMGAMYGTQIGDSSQAARFALAAAGYWPVIALMIAVVAFLAAFLPRAAMAIAWSLYGVVVLLAGLGDVLGLPHDVVAATLFWVVPQPGRAESSWLPVWLMGAAAVAVIAAALWRYRTRDEVTA